MSIYADTSDVEPYVKFIADDANDDLYKSVLERADDFINGELSSNQLPVFSLDSDIPTVLRSAAVYYAASDVILALYNGEEMPTQKDAYFQKAEELLEKYIIQKRTELRDSELERFNPVKHRKGTSYYQRKRRRPRA